MVWGDSSFLQESVIALRVEKFWLHCGCADPMPGKLVLVAAIALHALAQGDRRALTTPRWQN